MNFYNISKPLDTHYIAVSDIHELFIEEYGNKNGIPLIFFMAVLELEHHLFIKNILTLKNIV
jgi:hypothetical protein